MTWTATKPTVPGAKSARDEFVEALGGQDAVNRMAELWIHNEECPKCCSRVEEGPLKPGTSIELRQCEHCGHAWEWEPLPEPAAQPFGNSEELDPEATP